MDPYYVSGMDRRTVYETPFSGERISRKGNVVMENHVTGRETVYTRDGRVIHENDAREPWRQPAYHQDYYRPNYNPYNGNRNYNHNYRGTVPSVTIRF